jgi:hypothetical protein
MYSTTHGAFGTTSSTQTTATDQHDRVFMFYGENFARVYLEPLEDRSRGELSDDD